MLIKQATEKMNSEKAPKMGQRKMTVELAAKNKDKDISNTSGMVSKMISIKRKTFSS